MMSNDKMREEFEARVKAEQGLDLTRLPHGGYRSFATHQAWWAWQASCAAPAVQGEPVGWVNSDELDNMLDDRTATLFPVRTVFHGKPVYAAPQPAKRQEFKRFNGQECWMWAGDGSDRLETLTCPVVIAPADLMAIINRGSPASALAGLVEALVRERDQQRAMLKEVISAFSHALERGDMYQIMHKIEEHLAGTNGMPK